MIIRLKEEPESWRYYESKVGATHDHAARWMRMARVWTRWTDLRFKAPWAVYIRLQIVFVPLRLRFWLILAFQLQLYTKTSSIGQQAILDNEALPDTLIGHSSVCSSLCEPLWGRYGSIFTPDKKSSSRRGIHRLASAIGAGCFSTILCCFICGPTLPDHYSRSWER